MARDILGNLMTSPTVHFLLPQAHVMTHKEWGVIKKVYEKNPRARDDLSYLSECLERDDSSFPGREIGELLSMRDDYDRRISAVIPPPKEMLDTSFGDRPINQSISATSRHPPTMCGDSGYGSLGTQSVAPKRLDFHYVQEETEQAQTAMNPEEGQETGTVFSDAASLLQHPDVDKYISAFAKELATSIPPELYNNYLDAVPSTLDHLLKSFAVRLGHESPGRPQRQLMYLVYRFRSEIVRRLKRHLRTQDNPELESTSGTGGVRDSSLSTEPGMTLNEKIMMWEKESDGSNNHSADDCEGRDIDHATLDTLGDVDNLDGFDDFEFPELARYREILRGASAYQWLQSSLRVRGSLEDPEANTHIGYHHLGAEIIRAATSRIGNFSRKRTQDLVMHFTVDWDPILFAQEQQYDAPLRCVLAQAITLTGHGNNLQAATCESYLQQTWPESGLKILSLLQTAVERETDVCSSLLPDRTRLVACFNNHKLSLSVAGNTFSVAEVAEQVAWIGAALRSSPADTAAAYSTAHVTGLDFSIGTTIESADRIITVGCCNIEFKTEILQDTDLATAGRCWRGMFGNPVIVRGYPIRRRAEPDTGLEIPLDMVAALTKCQRVVNFAGTTFLKGFSATLTAVRVVGDEVLWHLCYNPGGEYISYEDSRASRGDETLPLGTLVKARHIVGWSNHVRNHVGAPDANYDIEWTELQEPSSSYVLEKVTLSGSVPFITPGGSFLVGVKDKPLHIGFGSGDDYLGTLMAIVKRYFVFYDSEEKRAWLVDGASAVLHLLRAYLKFYVEDRIVSSYFMYSDGDLTEAGPGVEYTGARAAFDILTNPRNQRLPLYPKGSVETEERTTRLGKALDAADSTTFKTTSSNFTLKDRVEQICFVLLQATAYHDDMNSRDGFGLRIKSLPRHQIVGFEFMDVATRQETLVPKVATIQSMSVGWVHLVRSLRAVTLFGAGFGELLQPVRGKGQAQACCSATSSVPTGQGLLAVYGADLHEMLRTGTKRRNPWRLAGDVHWHSPDGVAFHACKCKAHPGKQLDGSEGKKDDVDTERTPQKKWLRGLFRRPNEGDGRVKPGISDMVQVLLPTSFPGLYGRGLRSPTRIVPEGAVVFGHCWKYPLRWSLTKDVPPVPGEPEPASVDEVSRSMSDSGIGESVESSDSGPAPSSSHHLYGLGNNVTFLHRDGSFQSISSEPQSSKGLDISAGGAEAGQHAAEACPPSRTGQRKRPAVSLQSSDSGAATKVRRVSSGSNALG
ncbi:uncharacterized protein B0T15DRAFT_531556 [Chaetomium strumarium]|uniref:DUF7071 domain-containing protein n=1 Tax=Chaetomium strumarium TaxID=1170767 RepID=A0AAJ0GS74_9PEZI|nr:hypothetical protein B0T15DRAFT_531556 [Chaetomium strumarium]